MRLITSVHVRLITGFSVYPVPFRYMRQTRQRERERQGHMAGADPGLTVGGG